MTFRVKDVKLLWSTAGGRCSMPGCRLQLTAQGEPATLGDMAHIKGENQGSARVDAAMTDEERNAYGNLILLCPTHHREIDQLVGQWTVDKLLTTKTAHELWVRERLDSGQIVEPSLEGVAFVEERAAYWASRGQTWLVAGLTPLQVRTASDEFDPVKDEFVALLAGTRPVFSNPRFPNRVCPSENGLVYEDFREIADGLGFALEVFRSGHAEYALCLDDEIAHATKVVKLKMPPTSPKPWRAEASRYLLWHSLDRAVPEQADILRKLWDVGLPFEYALLSSILARSSSLALVTTDVWRGPPRPIEKDRLVNTQVISKAATAEEIEDALMTALVHSFGLRLPQPARDSTTRRFGTPTPF